MYSPLEKGSTEKGYLSKDLTSVYDFWNLRKSKLKARETKIKTKKRNNSWRKEKTSSNETAVLTVAKERIPKIDIRL